jgi:putative transposase
MGGESEAAWRALLDDLVKRGLRTPELVIVDGAPGPDKALAARWSDVLVRRCAVHKHRNLLAHAPERRHEDRNEAGSGSQTKSFPAKMAAEMSRGGGQPGGSRRQALDLHALSKKPMEIHSNVESIERLHEEFKRRIKTQTVLPSAETAAMLFWALLASGQITMRKVDGWESFAERPSDQIIDLAA